MLTINELYDLSHSLAGDYLKQFTYPWEALAGISDLILEIGKQLPVSAPLSGAAHWWAMTAWWATPRS